jgi:hypothetical protein
MQAPQLLGYRRGVQPSSVENVTGSPARNIKQDGDYVEMGSSCLIFTSALIVNQERYTQTNHLKPLGQFSSILSRLELEYHSHNRAGRIRVDLVQVNKQSSSQYYVSRRDVKSLGSWYEAHWAGI